MFLPRRPAPTTFKPMGYVEKAGGQLEAIILQENEVQVVHIGDLIAGRYRVTKITPDSVDAIDETLVQSPMAKPNGAESKELTAGVAQEPSTPPVAVAQAQPRLWRLPQRAITSRTLKAGDRLRRRRRMLLRLSQPLLPACEGRSNRAPSRR